MPADNLAKNEVQDTIGLQLAGELVDSAEVQIIHAVTEYQMSAAEWGWAEIVKELLVWKGYLIEDFKVRVPDFDVPELAFCIDKLPARTLGHYRGRYNGFGLRREIAFNSAYIQKDNFWDVIGTLAHELIHAHQDMVREKAGETDKATKQRKHHDKAFREIAAKIGLLVNEKGVQTYDLKAKTFFEFLKSHDKNLLLPDLTKPLGQTEKKKGKSTLKKWGCGCQEFRSGKSELHFQCTMPGCGEFVRILTDRPASKTAAALSSAKLSEPTLRIHTSAGG